MGLTYYNQKELKESFGFSQKLITQLLREPDTTGRNPKSRKRPIKKYESTRVIAAMQTDAFKKYKEKPRRKINTDKTIATKKFNLLKKVEQTPISVDFYRNFDELVKDAGMHALERQAQRRRVKHHELDRFYNPSGYDLAKFATNYLLYEGSNYLSLKWHLKTEIGKVDALFAFRKRILLQIKEWYPQLSSYIDELLYVEDDDNEKIVTDDGVSKPYAVQIHSVLEKMDEFNRPTLTTRRLEQSFLREHLFKGKEYGVCMFCDGKYPKKLCYCSHTKQRSYCSVEELKDSDVAVLLCWSCDELFDKGFIGVKDGIIVQIANRSYTFAAQPKIDILVGRVCTIYGSSNEHYFDWHYNYNQL